MAAAWDIDFDHPERFVGMPKWAESARFDIHARTLTNTSGSPLRLSGFIDDDVRQMLRELRVERFQIKWHYEDRPVEAFLLVAAKPKLKKADTGNRAACRLTRGVAADRREVDPRLFDTINCRNVTIAQLAMKFQELEPNKFAYPVEDATGIVGRWDLTLNFTPNWVLNRAANQTTSAASEPNGVVLLEEAVSRQVGLKLEKRKRFAVGRGDQITSKRSPRITEPWASGHRVYRGRVELAALAADPIHSPHFSCRHRRYRLDHSGSTMRRAQPKTRGGTRNAPSPLIVQRLSSFGFRWKRGGFCCIDRCPVGWALLPNIGTLDGCSVGSTGLDDATPVASIM